MPLSQRCGPFDVNETLLDMHALDGPFEMLLGSASLRSQWFALMLQLAFTGGLAGQYVDFTTAQRAALAMLAEREGVPLTASDIDGLVGRMSSQHSIARPARKAGWGRVTVARTLGFAARRLSPI